MITITNEDNMALMSRYSDKYFDLAIVDPPYGIKAEKGTPCVRGKIPQNKKWDVRPPELYFKQLFRVSKNQIIWGGNYFCKYLPVSSGWVCWYKTKEITGRSFSEYELAFTSFNGPARLFEYKPFLQGNDRIHPTQKPVALYKWLLSKYARPGWKILDTHLGSGSIAVACIDMGFDLTACELDKDYFDAAQKRIQEHQSQQELFVASEMITQARTLFDGGDNE
jgi:site-specific DNA-methyltransferase (adenine-specific)